MAREVRKNFNHISDCWQALRECTTVAELEEQFGWFPRWSGDWSWEADADGNVVVCNEYEDPNMGWQTDCESMDICVESDIDSDDLFE